MKIKRYLLIFTIYCFGSSLCAQQTEKEHLLIGYVFGDLMEKAEKPIQAEKLTHLNYAFADIENGKINIADEDFSSFPNPNGLLNKVEMSLLLRNCFPNFP